MQDDGRKAHTHKRRRRENHRSGPRPEQKTTESGRTSGQGVPVVAVPLMEALNPSGAPRQLRAPEEVLVLTERALVELYVGGLVCDTGIRRDGEIVWIVRPYCDRCSGQRVSAPGVRSPDRLPCDDALRSLKRVRAALSGKRN